MGNFLVKIQYLFQTDKLKNVLYLTTKIRFDGLLTF